MSAVNVINNTWGNGEPLHLRLNDQSSDYYRTLPDKPVEMHFNTPGHTFDDLTAMIIEQIRVASATHRNSREFKAFGSIRVEELSFIMPEKYS